MVLQTFFKDYEGTNLVSEKTPDDLMEELEDREHLLTVKGLPHRPFTDLEN